MAATTLPSGEPAPEDTSLYPIAVLIDELKNEDVQVRYFTLLKMQITKCYISNGWIGKKLETGCKSDRK